MSSRIEDYHTKLLNEHLEEDNSEMSVCCNAPSNYGFCSQCGEHSESNIDHSENMMQERADNQRELEREYE